MAIIIHTINGTLNPLAEAKIKITKKYRNITNTHLLFLDENKISILEKIISKSFYAIIYSITV